MTGPTWNRLAAATGLDFVVAVAGVMILQRIEGHAGVGQFALESSDGMWGTAVLLLGLAGALFLWFTTTFSARLRQLEVWYGGSGRLAAAVLAAGSIIAGVFAVEVAVQFATRNLEEAGTNFGALATSLVEGPTLAFPIAVYLGAAGLVAFRTPGLPPPSRVVGRLSLPLAAVFVVIAGVQIFKNYAWVDETLLILFLAWVAAVSSIGITRWGDLEATDEVRPSARRVPSELRPERGTARDVEPTPKPAPVPRRLRRTPRVAEPPIAEAPEAEAPLAEAPVSDPGDETRPIETPRPRPRPRKAAPKKAASRKPRPRNP